MERHPGAPRFFNLNFGPFGSGVWHKTKRAALKRWVETRDHTDPEFQAELSQIGLAHGFHDVDSELIQRTLFNKTATMRGWIYKGPALKLSRWGSIRQVRDYHRKDMWASRMILRGISMVAGNADEADAERFAAGLAASENQDQPSKKNRPPS